MKKIFFDTLQHAKILRDNGVRHADTHARALASSLPENICIKSEVDNMLEAALKRFDERTYQMRDEFKQSLKESEEQTKQMQLEMKLEMKAIEKNIVETNNKTIHRLTINIGFIMLLLLVISSAFHLGFR